MKAKLFFTIKPWTGWSREQPEAKNIELEVETGQKITSGMFEKSFSSYSFSVDSINPGEIKIDFDGLVIRGNEKGINLRGPSSGRIILGINQYSKFSTPTMDSGTSITVLLKEIK